MRKPVFEGFRVKTRIQFQPVAYFRVRPQFEQRRNTVSISIPALNRFYIVRHSSSWVAWFRKSST